MNLTAQVKARVQKKVEQCVGKANLHFKKLYKVPSIHYDVKGTLGGYANQNYEVHFNPILLMENLDDYIENTVPHEVAHIIDTANGDNARPALSSWAIENAMFLGRRFKRPKRSIHGPSWQLIMRVFGVQDITRCHDYDTTNSRVKTKTKFEYKCGGCSRQFFVSSVIHNKIGRGQKRWCKSCGREDGQLIYVQNLGQKTYTEAKAISEERKVVQLAPKAPAPKPEALSLTDRARKIYGLYGYLGRQVCIRKMGEIGIKDTTASTYYQNFKSGK